MECTTAVRGGEFRFTVPHPKGAPRAGQSSLELFQLGSKSTRLVSRFGHVDPTQGVIPRIADLDPTVPALHDFNQDLLGLGGIR